MNAHTAIQPSIVAALAKALPELESAKKNKANPAFKSKFADLGAVIEAIEPIRAHGLWYRQVQHERDDGAQIETIYIHESGEQLTAGSLFMPASKKDAQGFGSALTYCRRYSLQTAFGLATEDDDGNAAVAGGQSSKSAVNPPRHAFITDGQLGELQQLLDHLNVPVAEVLAVGKINSLRDLGADRFEGVRSWINTRAKELHDAKAEPVA